MLGTYRYGIVDTHDIITKQLIAELFVNALLGGCEMNFNIGPRMMKTGLAVALSILIAESLQIELGIVAVITAVIAMQPSIMRSVNYIKEVTLSTLIGTVFALI